MLDFKKFKTVRYQAVLFTPDSEVSSALLSRKLLGKWSERFDADPTAVPNLPGLPAEVPRLTLTSSSGDYRCEFAPARLSLVWTSQQAFDVEAAPLGVVNSLALEYAEELSPRVARLAVIVTRVVKDENPGRALSSHFCRDKWLDAPFNRPESFEIHSHKKYRTSFGQLVNSWVRSRSGAVREKSGLETAVVTVEQDINTPGEDMGTADFSPDQISTFLDSSTTEFDEILSLYFPEKQ